MKLLLYLLISLLISELLPIILKKTILNNSLDSQKKEVINKKNKTPILGGFIFIIPISLYLILNKNIKLLSWLLFSTIFGLYDDYKKIINKRTSKGLNKFSKLLFLIINYIYYCYIFEINKFNLVSFIYYLLIYTGVLVTDGIDGLLGTLSLNTVLFSNIDTYFKKIIITCLLPFLNKNLNPAKIFMGDTGSTFLAALIYHFTINQKYLGIIYLIGSVTSVLQILTIKLLKKKILNFSPFHHNLETLDWTENQIVIFYNLVNYLIIFYNKL